MEFRVAVANTIPSLVKLLDAKARGVRRKAVELIGNLANHGKRKLDGISAHLIGIAKSIFIEPSQE